MVALPFAVSVVTAVPAAAKVRQELLPDTLAVLLVKQSEESAL